MRYDKNKLVNDKKKLDFIFISYLSYKPIITEWEIDYICMYLDGLLEIGRHN